MYITYNTVRYLRTEIPVRIGARIVVATHARLEHNEVTYFSGTRNLMRFTYENKPAVL